MDELDISKYEEADLYNLLDVPATVRDRELEAKILSMINEYKQAKITSSGDRDDEYDKVIAFMIDIYKYFFDDGSSKKPYKYFAANDKLDISDLGKADYEKREIAYKINGDTYDENNKIPLDRKDNANDNTYTTFGFSYPLQYATDDKGQIINQVTKRVVTINSNARARTTETTSSEFTLNLSDTLKNVVKLKLYSVSIPYSWYTISEDYGSNFLYLKGNSPGINNSTHDIRIQIEPGNYASEALIETLNDAISHLAGKEIIAPIEVTEYNSTNNKHIRDISLNNTNFVKGNNTGKTTFYIDIKKNYDSNYFHIRFPYITSVYNIDNTRNNNLSIPSFLGFTTETLNSYTLYSELSNNNLDSVTTTIDESNNVIKIIRYIDESNTFDGTKILKTIDITLDNANEISLNGLITDLNNKLLINTSDIDTISEYKINPSGNYLKIKLIRDDSINHINTKIIILLLDNDKTDIWSSVLKFKLDGRQDYEGKSYQYKILNDIISQEPVVDDRIIVSSSKHIKIEFEPILDNYNINYNTFSITIPENNTGYTISEFIDTINNEITNISQNYTDKHNPNGVFNTNNKFNINANNELEFIADISYNIGISNYVLDLSNTMLGNIFNNDTILDVDIPNKYHDYDLSSNNGIIEEDNINTQTSYNINNIFNNPNVDYVLKLKPKQDGPLKNLPDINIKPEYIDESNNIINYQTETSVTIEILEYYIKRSIQSYIDNSFNIPQLLKNSDFILTDTNGILKFSLLLYVSDYLDETNYELKLSDRENIWVNKFHLNSSYNLSNNNVISSNKSVDKDVINITSVNQKLIIEPILPEIDGGSNGVYDILNRNTVTLNVPYGSYTRNELIARINNLLRTTTIANGKIISYYASFDIKTINGTEYCIINYKINRMFRAEDYKVVFFDNTFTSCNKNSTSIQNTTYDSTIGYILGYRDKTEYPLISVIDSAVAGQKQFVSRFPLNVNLYNEFSIVLDDYNNNRMPSAIVSGEPPATDISIPSYAKRTAAYCDENGNLVLSTKDKNNNNLTLKQLSAVYSNIETAQAKQSDIFTANKRVIAKDVFAVIPLNISGISVGELFVKEGVTLLEQQRSYFGPVDIQRISVKLLTDKGNLVNLNGADWSFSFVCEQLNDNSFGNYVKQSAKDGKKS